ncbi:MAG: hypothetical protein A2138_21240 [Deltaproteobacteria bacterium RBG_16_71_12]|nr:MAG: hypothetical protein A2138_21240 [Deltaproteobacteria bacterium RBG_16_71_12]
MRAVIRLARLTLGLVVGCSSTTSTEVSFGSEPQLSVSGSVVRFASAAEGRALLGAPDGFTLALSAFDRSLRLGTARDVSDDEYRSHVGAQTLEWTRVERNEWVREVRELDRALQGLELCLPPEVLLVKTTGRDEMGAAYTRGAAIVLPVEQAARARIGLLAHELFHIASRACPKQRERLYALIGFSPLPRVSPPSEHEERRITNPDAERLDAYVVVEDGAEQHNVVPLLVSGVAIEQAISGHNWFRSLKVLLLEIDPKLGRIERDAGGRPRVLDAARTDWTSRLAKNTDYAIHPEEVLAENFALLVKRRRGERLELNAPELVDALEASLGSVSGSGERCALVVTDDDIPSGSATAGALFVGEDELGRRLLTNDAIAVARGFVDAGFPCVVVADSHEGAIDAARVKAAGFRTTTPTDPTWMWPLVGVAGPRYDVAALVGYHGRAGAGGFRDHTLNDFVSAEMNGKDIGEVELLALGLSALGTRVVLVTGDHAAVAEAKAASPTIESVAVRWRNVEGQSRFLSESEAPSILEAAARRAAKKAVPLLTSKVPLELRVRARGEASAKAAVERASSALVAGRERLSTLLEGPLVVEGTLTREGKSLVWRSPTALGAFVSLIVVASACRPPQEAWGFIEEGYRAYQAGSYETAIAAYERALELDPDDVATWCRIGRARLAHGKRAEARAAFSAAMARIDDVNDQQMKEVCTQGASDAAAK